MSRCIPSVGFRLNTLENSNTLVSNNLRNLQIEIDINQSELFRGLDRTGKSGKSKKRQTSTPIRETHPISEAGEPKKRDSESWGIFRQSSQPQLSQEGTFEIGSKRETIGRIHRKAKRISGSPSEGANKGHSTLRGLFAYGQRLTAWTGGLCCTDPEQPLVRPTQGHRVTSPS